MTDGFWNSFFGCLPAFVIALGGLISSMRNRSKLNMMSNKVDQTHDQVNGRMSQLIQGNIDSVPKDVVSKIVEQTEPKSLVSPEKK